MPKNKLISWNDIIEVQLNEYGLKIYNDYFKSRGIKDLMDSTYFKIGKNNKIKHELHFIALVFGDSLWLGNHLPFTTTDIKVLD